MKSAFLIAFLSAVSISAPAIAADPAPEAMGLLGELAICREISSPEERLGCYDIAVNKLTESVEQNEIVVLDRESLRQTRRSLFGFSLPRLPFWGNDDEEGDKEELREVESTLVRVVQSGSGLWILHLADDTTWQTTEIMRFGEPKQGDEIRIRKGALSSYLANISGARAVRVQRVR